MKLDLTMRFPQTFLIWLLVLFPGSAIPAEPATGPRITFEAETVQMGQVVRGQVVEAEFVYRNEGDVPLRILRAKPG